MNDPNRVFQAATLPDNSIKQMPKAGFKGKALELGRIQNHSAYCLPNDIIYRGSNLDRRANFLTGQWNEGSACSRKEDCN